MLDRRVLKENEVFAVTDREGNMLAESAEGHGLYFRDTRFLSTFEFSVDNVLLQLLSSTGELNFMCNFQFGNGAGHAVDGTEIPPRTVSIRRNRFIHGGLHERIGLLNYNPFPITVRVRLTFGSDFRDMFDVRGHAGRAQHGLVGTPIHRKRLVTLRYHGLDRVLRTTQIRFDADPERVEMLKPTPLSNENSPPGNDLRAAVGPRPPLASATFLAELPPHQPWSLSIRVAPAVGRGPAVTQPAPSIEKSFNRVLEAHSEWEASCTRIVTDHDLLNALIRQSLHDLRLMVNQVATGLLPVGGIPWFAVPFGRDSLITSLQTLSLNSDIAYGTLRFLAYHQGKEIDPWRDEEPGKILHEIRGGEMAALGEVPQTPYYGSVDSTPLFVVLFAELMRWTGDPVLAADLRPHVDRALHWIRVHGDRDGDGLLEYESRSAGGIHNQGWKDSFDAVAFPDGRYPETPVAVAEVQGYAYAAEMRMAALLRQWGEKKQADFLERLACRRKERFEETFWLEDQGFYALALDGHKTPVPSPTSNPGHCLLMDLVSGSRADRLVNRLMQSDLLSGWGLRTLSSAYPTFNPMSYHNGSIWPHDNSLVAAGLRHRGYDAAALQVMDQILGAGLELPSYRMPELFCGFSRDQTYQSAPATYPLSCTPQAWAAGAVFLILQHLAGIEPDLLHRRLTLRPALLPWLNELRFENLRLGDRRLTIQVWRDRGEVKCEVQGSDGLEVRVS